MGAALKIGIQVRTLEIPLDSALAINTRSQQLQNKQEQEQLKRLVSHRNFWQISATV